MSGAPLETRHHPVTGRFPDARDPQVQRRYELDEARVERFREQGYLTDLELLSRDEVQELGERLDDIGRRLPELLERLYEVEAAWLERPHEVVLHLLGAWMVDELFHDLIFHPGVTVPVAQILGTDRLRFWHDQVFWKPAHHPGVVPWHQDYSYWTRTGPPAHGTMFITLDDMDAENGGLEYVPGSHLWGLLPMQSFGGELDALLPSLDREQRAAFAPVSLELRAGQGSIHHSHLVHGSRANESDRARRAIALNYVADGTLVLDDSAPLLAGVAPIPRGAPLEGTHFPLVLDRSSA